LRIHNVAENIGLNLKEILKLKKWASKEIDNATISQEDHCISLKQRYNVTIKKQSLAERFHETAMRFI